MRPLLVFSLAILTAIAIGCARSGRDSPLLPQNNLGNQAAPITAGGQSNRQVLGLWRVHVSDDRMSAEVVPLRSADMHLNTVRMLEVAPCTGCLKAENFAVFPGDIVQCDIRLKHPLASNIKWAGFDVRGIFISKPDFTFPASGRKVAMGEGVPKMLDPDCFTTLFNPTEFPPDSATFAALKYFPGNYSPGGDLSATLNPYVAFNKKEPRRCFEIQSESIETIQIHLPHGASDFGYAVDACWQNVVGGIIDPVKDMPLDANCLEAYAISVWAGPGLSLDPGAWTWVYARVYDRQGLDTIAAVTAEIPGVISGTVELGFSQALPDGGAVYKGKVMNELSAPTGDYPCLVRVIDTEEDQNLGAIDAWNVGSLPVRRGWVLTWGGWDNDTSYWTAMDEAGNSYSLGHAEHDADLDPTPGYSPVPADQSVSDFLVKFDWGGGFEWSSCWDEISNISAASLAIDHGGNPLVAGSFHETRDLDPGPGVDEHTAVGNRDMLLLKMSPDGQLLWSLVWPEEGDMGNSVVRVASDSGIFLAGMYEGTCDLDPGPGIDQHTSTGDHPDAFLVKLSSDGAFEWDLVWDPSDSIHITDIKETAEGDIVITGCFRGILDLDPGPGAEIQDSEGVESAFIIRLDPDGGFKWGVAWTATAEQMPMYTPAVAIDSNDNIYVTDEFGYLTDLDPSPELDLRFSNGATDIFLSKFDAEGNYLWAITWGGTYVDDADSILIDNSQTLWVGGGFSETVDFDPGPDSDLHSAAKGDTWSFLSKFDLDGNYLGVQIWDQMWPVHDLNCDQFNNVYFGWYFGFHSGAMDFDPGPKEDIHSSVGPDTTPEHADDAFLVKTPADGNWW